MAGKLLKWQETCQNGWRGAAVLAGFPGSGARAPGDIMEDPGHARTTRHP